MPHRASSKSRAYITVIVHFLYANLILQNFDLTTFASASTRSRIFYAEIFQKRSRSFLSSAFLALFGCFCWGWSSSCWRWTGFATNSTFDLLLIFVAQFSEKFDFVYRLGPLLLKETLEMIPIWNGAVKFRRLKRKSAIGICWIMNFLWSITCTNLASLKDSWAIDILHPLQLDRPDFAY